MITSYRMTPKRRFLSALFGGRVDRTPVGSATSVATVEQEEMTGCYFPEAHVDGVKMAHLAAGAYEILGYDCIMPVFSVVAESAALGCEIDWGDKENMPINRSSPWKEPEDVVIPDDFLERPTTKACLDAIKILRKTYGDRVAIMGKVMGPWTLAYHMHGIQDFLMETITEPEKVRLFLTKLKEITILFGKAQIEAGADVLCVADHATGDLVSAKTYFDFLLPLHKELTLKIGCPMVLHICGNTLDRMKYIAESGFDCFHFDSKVDAKDAVKEIDGKISLMGNVNNPEVLLNGNPSEVSEKVAYALRAGVQIVGPECAVPLKTPLENLKEIVNAVESFFECV
ncbi:MAG: MtaA/CmuA family methyltransferase [Actinobacteria bacterium]|nr:MtaA/CmuA family methyltransferase [Actinomycetota bacterium]